MVSLRFPYVFPCFFAVLTMFFPCLLLFGCFPNIFPMYSLWFSHGFPSFSPVTSGFAPCGEVSAVVAGAKDELTKLPLPAAARALVVLAASTHDGDGYRGGNGIGRT